MKRPLNGFAAALSAAILAGCASTDGLAPRAAITSPERLGAAQSLARAAVATDAWPADEWWRGFGDAQLDALISEGLAGNPTLQEAAARTQQALAQAGVADSTRYAQIGVEGSSTRELFPGNSLIPPPYAGSWNTLNQLEATFSWQLDFWGKNRSAFQSALGEARATAIDASAARLALSVGIAHAYVGLQHAYLQLDVAEATLKQREQIYALTRDRNVAGIDSRLELKQAESALPATRQQIEQWHEAIELARNELAALLGKGPDRGLAITRPTANALPDAVLPTRLPSELLGRRPDLLAQRLRIEASRQGVNSAKAAFYPDVNLAAVVGFQSFGTSGLLSAANREIGVAPALTLPIFDAGQRRADLAAKDAAYDMAVERYNQTLVDALREVADQLASFRSLDLQRTDQREALATAQEAYDLAVLRYREGVGNYLQVLTTQSQLLAAQSLDADLRTSALDLSINLIRALGGGLDAPAPAAASLPPNLNASPPGVPGHGY